jgi:hypothetical protein
MKSTSINSHQHRVHPQGNTALITILSAAVFTLFVTEARAGLLGAPYSEKFDFSKVMPKLEPTQVLNTNTSTPVTLEVTSAPGATVKNQKQGTGSWAYLFLTQYPEAREAVKTVAADALRSRGMDPAAQSSPLKVSIVLDRFTVEKPHEKSKGFGPIRTQEKNFNRFAFIEGRLQVSKEGKVRYERQLAVQAARAFGEKADNLGKISPLAGMLVGKKESKDGSCELLIEVLQRFQNALIADEKLLGAMEGREPRFAAVATQR